MKNIINTIKSWWSRLWARNHISEPVKKKVKRQQRDRFHHGSHYYLTDLLDQMDRAFEGMKALKKADPIAFRRFQKMSCNVYSKDYIAYAGDGREWASQGNQFAIKVNEIPAQGCVFVPHYWDNEDRELCFPIFIYYSRIKKPINVQQANGVVLEVGICWGRRDDPVVAETFFVSVNDDCSVQVLKTLVPKHEKVQRKVKRKHTQDFSIIRTTWIEPRVLQDMSEHRSETPEETAYSMVWMAINGSLATDSGINVRVSKGTKRVTFAIDMLRTPYFFKDREKVVNENGNTKKIFHIVAAHKRVVNGVEQVVKSHTRGLRKFMWNDYAVNILLLGKHVHSINEFTSPAIEEVDAKEQGIKTIEAGEAMGKLSKIFDDA